MALCRALQGAHAPDFGEVPMLLFMLGLWLKLGVPRVWACSFRVSFEGFGSCRFCSGGAFCRICRSYYGFTSANIEWVSPGFELGVSAFIIGLRVRL